MTNDYKKDDGKPPVLDAVLIPFRRTLLAVAAMAEDMRAKHQLAGSNDPYQEWRQLPDGKSRLSNAGARHAMNPWAVNTRDGQHLHIMHAIWGLMAAYEKHLSDADELEAMEPALSDVYADGEPVPADAPVCCGAADAKPLPMLCSSWHAATDQSCTLTVGHEGGHVFAEAAPVHGPAGADWRERLGTRYIVKPGDCKVFPVCGAINRLGGIHYCALPLDHRGDHRDGIYGWCR